MSDGKWIISATGTYASGTYYGMFTGTFTGTFIWQEFRVDVLMSGTCFKVVEGTAENSTVAEVWGYEGQFFVKGNEDNFLVADVELMPIRRNARHFGHAGSYTRISYEFPHHHRAPEELDGDVSLIYESASTNRLYGLLLYNHYIFSLGWDDNTIVRYNMDTGESISQDALGNSYQFSVIDDNTVVIDEYSTYKRLNMLTGDKETICSCPYDSYHYPHMAVVKDVLCVGQVREYTDDDPSPSYLKRQFYNGMFNIWTGETLYSSITPKIPGDSNILNWHYDQVVNKDFFWLMQRNGDTWPEVVGHEPAVIYRMRTAPEVYGGGEGPFAGEFEYSVTPVGIYNQWGTAGIHVEDMCYNPFNQLIYFTAIDYESAPGTDYYSCIGVLSPENLSYSFIYYRYISSGLPNRPGAVRELIPAFDEVYARRGLNTWNDEIINVRNLQSQFIYHSYDGMQGKYGAPVVDINDRYWYFGRGFIDDVTYLYGRNIRTGEIEVTIDTGIGIPWGDLYYYPTDQPYKYPVPYNDAILIFKHNTIQYAYQGRPYIGDRRTQIYKVT